MILAAAMAERGGFAEIGPNEVAKITYIGLGSGDKVVDSIMTSPVLDADWEKLITLISRYQSRSTGYTARRSLFDTEFARDYDHLSRFGEWEMTDRAVASQLVGPGGNHDPK
jgi:hypothetical protein